MCERILREMDPDNLLMMAIDGLAMHRDYAYTHVQIVNIVTSGYGC